MIVFSRFASEPSVAQRSNYTDMRVWVIRVGEHVRVRNVARRASTREFCGGMVDGTGVVRHDGAHDVSEGFTLGMYAPPFIVKVRVCAALPRADRAWRSTRRKHSPCTIRRVLTNF